jgi:hypothetical protein
MKVRFVILREVVNQIVASDWDSLVPNYLQMILVVCVFNLMSRRVPKLRCKCGSSRVREDGGQSG